MYTVNASMGGGGWGTRRVLTRCERVLGGCSRADHFNNTLEGVIYGARYIHIHRWRLAVLVTKRLEIGRY